MIVGEKAILVFYYHDGESHQVLLIGETNTRKPESIPQQVTRFLGGSAAATDSWMKAGEMSSKCCWDLHVFKSMEERHMCLYTYCYVYVTYINLTPFCVCVSKNMSHCRIIWYI